MKQRHWLWVPWALAAILLLTACGGARNLGMSQAENASSTEPAGVLEADGDGGGYAFREPAPAGRPVVAQTSASAPSPGVERKSPVHPSPPPSPPAAEEPSAVEEPTSATSESPQRRPLLIYTAQVHLAVFEAKKTLADAEKLLRDMQGYLVEQTDRSITFRVPAEKFEDTLKAALALGDVLHQEVKARDVTDEFMDLETRLHTLEAIRGRLQELLARAEKVEDALAVERELGRVIGEIEQIKGRLKLLRELVAFSTITLHVRPRAVEHLDPTFRLPFPWLQTLGLGELLAL